MFRRREGGKGTSLTALSVVLMVGPADDDDVKTFDDELALVLVAELPEADDAVAVVEDPPAAAAAVAGVADEELPFELLVDAEEEEVAVVVLAVEPEELAAWWPPEVEFDEVAADEGVAASPAADLAAVSLCDFICDVKFLFLLKIYLLILLPIKF